MENRNDHQSLPDCLGQSVAEKLQTASRHAGVGCRNRRNRVPRRVNQHRIHEFACVASRVFIATDGQANLGQQAVFFKRSEKSRIQSDQMQLTAALPLPRGELAQTIGGGGINRTGLDQIQY